MDIQDSKEKNRAALRGASVGVAFVLGFFVLLTGPLFGTFTLPVVLLLTMGGSFFSMLITF